MAHDQIIGMRMQKKRTAANGRRAFFIICQMHTQSDDTDSNGRQQFLEL